MKLEQYKAIMDFCKANGYRSQEAFLNDLKKWGYIDERSGIEDLAGDTDDDSYETMYKYLMDLLGV